MQEPVQGLQGMNCTVLQICREIAKAQLPYTGCRAMESLNWGLIIHKT
jgi:hypothetical protein